MAENSGIAWTKHTFNPVWGCTKYSPGCDGCYAEAGAARFGTDWGPRAERRTFPDKHWDSLRKWDEAAAAAGRSDLVFCGSYCDVFERHPVTEREVLRLWAEMRVRRHLTFQLVTKRTREMVDKILTVDAALPGGFRSVFPHVWAVTSVENQEWADKRLPEIVRLNGVVSVVGLSIEPQIGEVDLRPWLYRCGVCGERPPSGMMDSRWRTNAEGVPEHACTNSQAGHFTAEADPLFQWAIVGGESSQPGHPAREYKLEWAWLLLNQLRRAGVAAFVKQTGSNATHGAGPFTTKDRKGADPSEWPLWLNVAEFPHGWRPNAQAVALA